MSDKPKCTCAFIKNVMSPGITLMCPVHGDPLRRLKRDG